MPDHTDAPLEPSAVSQPKANAAGITDEQLRLLGLDVCAEIQASDNAREFLLKRWERLVKLFELDGTVTNLNLIPGTATYPLPLSRQKLQEIISQVHRAITGFEPFVQLIPRSDNEDEIAAAERLQGAIQMLATLDNGRMGFSRALRMILKLAVNTGVAIMLHYVDAEEGAPKYECISAQDFVFYPAEKIDIKRAKTIGHKITMLASEIAEKQESGEYLKFEVGSEDTYDSRAGLSERQAGQTQSEPVRAGDEKITCYQIVRRCRFAKRGAEPEDGGKINSGYQADDGKFEDSKDYLLTVAYDAQKILRIEPLKYKTGRLYFDLRLDEDYGSFWPGSSPGNLLQAAQLMFQDIAYTICIGGLASAFPETDVTGESAPTGTKVQRRGPGSRTYHPNADVKIHTTQTQFNASALAEGLRIIMQIADEIARVTPVGTTEPMKSGTSGSEAQAFMQNKQQQLDTYTEIIMPGVGEIASFTIELLRVHFPLITRKQGTLGLKDHNDTKVKVRCRPTGISTGANPQVIQNKLTMAGEIAADPTSGFDKAKIDDMRMRALNLPVLIESLKKKEPSLYEIASILAGAAAWIEWQTKGGQGDPPPNAVPPQEMIKIAQEVMQGIAGKKDGPQPLNDEGEGAVQPKPTLASLGQSQQLPPPTEPPMPQQEVA